MIVPKVLLVDDEDIFRDSVKGFLESNRFHVVAIKGAEEAIVRLSKEFFDVIVCDVYMPFFATEEGGIEIARFASEKYPASFTILISQYVTEAMINRLMDDIPHKRFRFLAKSKDFTAKLIQVIEKCVEAKHVFVCMPFSDDFREIWEHGIKAAVEELGFHCRRGDEIFHVGGIIDKVYDLISSAHIIVADMTNRNANVFYEVGYAHGVGKPVVLLTQKVEEIPIDLRKYAHIDYGGKIPRLKEELKKTIQEILK